MYRTTQTTTPDQRLSKKEVATLVIGLCALVRSFHSRRSYATAEGREAKVTSVFLPWRPATEIDGALWAFPSPRSGSMSDMEIFQHQPIRNLTWDQNRP